ncbi:YdcF family protein [Aliishimia ponticola]|uniref:YdcF family protein n=1 Tax=Aliishimia ponticola TaxID=2499833 RepID=A0A4S4NKT7_9RHOB|nr:YdcF family protein [Aliishimia ponticola]THH38908.1 YdcF family protein [Aliishimia ponticola]
MTRALIILGAAVWPGGRPSPTLERRVNKAIALWREGGFDLVIPSGGPSAHPPTEAEVMQHMLIGAGVPESAILPEPYSTTTLTNAVNSAALLRPLTRPQVVVVTDGYHGLRSALTFRRLGLAARVVSADDAPPTPRWQVRLKGQLRECAALPVYALKLYARALPAPHPDLQGVAERGPEPTRAPRA